MWCIGTLSEEYRQRMYDLLDLYARPFHPQEPVVCLDEKSKQMFKDSRPPLPIQAGSPAKQDYEYVRAGTCNLFVAVEPKGGRRTVVITDHRAKTDFVAFVQYLLEQVYATARRIHLVMDNLNTHFRKCFDEVLGVKKERLCCGESCFTTRRNTPVGSIWLKSKSAFLTASALIGACRIARRSSLRWTLGNCAATRSNVASSGNSLGRMQTQKWLNIMFRN